MSRLKITLYLLSICLCLVFQAHHVVIIGDTQIVQLFVFRLGTSAFPHIKAHLEPETCYNLQEHTECIKGKGTFTLPPSAPGLKYPFRAVFFKPVWWRGRHCSE